MPHVASTVDSYIKTEFYRCEFCLSYFLSAKVLESHTKKCKSTKRKKDQNGAKMKRQNSNNLNSLATVTPGMSFSAVVETDVIRPFMPIYSPPNSVGGGSLLLPPNEINEAYEIVIHWRKNIFELPKGKSGKLFITEITKFIQSWCNKDSNREIAFKAIAIMPHLLLQKTAQKLKAKELKGILDRRIELWKKGKNG